MSPVVHPARAYPIWWLDPGKLILRFMLPIYLFVALVVPAFWPELIVLRARAYMDTEYVLLGALALVLMGLAAHLGSMLRVGEPEASSVPREVDERFLVTIGTLAALAYVIWFWPAITSGKFDLEREELNQTPGVTSFTQLGLTYVVCYLYVTLRSKQKLSFYAHALFRALLLLAVARVYLWSERLALIELAVPCAALILRYHHPHRRGVQRAFTVARRGGPLLAIPLLLAFFTATEVVRSWTYQSFKQTSLLDYMISRVTTYYYTALNNGAGMLETTPYPSYEMVFIGEWIYRLPFGIGAFFWENLGHAELPHYQFLERFGDIEFNNMSGIYPVMFDVGIAGGLAYFALVGLAMGVLYRLFLTERPIGLLLLPSVVVACSEVLRVLYLNNTRCFLVVVGALIAATQLRRPRERERAATVSAQGALADSFATTHSP